MTMKEELAETIPPEPEKPKIELASDVPVPIVVESPPNVEPVADALHAKIDRIAERIEHLSGKIEGLTARTPEPVAPPVLPAIDDIKEEVKEDIVEDAPDDDSIELKIEPANDVPSEKKKKTRKKPFRRGKK